MRVSRRALVAAGTAVVLGVGGVVVLAQAGTRSAGQATPAPTPSPRATVEVVRQDLVVTQEVTGTLDFADARELSVHRPGTLTWLPQVGTVVGRGDALVRVDDEPVPLFLGDTPLYRELDGSGLRGRDVDVVAANLLELGHLDVFPPGDVTGPRFARGVRAWREANGLGPVPIEPAGSGADGATGDDGPAAGDGAAADDHGSSSDGAASGVEGSSGDRGSSTSRPRSRTDVIRPGDAVVLPEPVRVSAVLAQLGDASDAGPVLRVTSTRRVVRVRADAVGGATLTADAPVTVTLPGGAEVAGTVTSVGTSPEGEAEAVVELADQAALEGVDSGPVTVRVEVERRPQVLTVPVAALLALAEGGHALQLEDGTLVGVELGLVTADLAEVSGEGVREGMSVVTAR